MDCREIINVHIKVKFSNFFASDILKFLGKYIDFENHTISTTHNKILDLEILYPGEINDLITDLKRILELLDKNKMNRMYSHIEQEHIFIEFNDKNILDGKSLCATIDEMKLNNLFKDSEKIKIKDNII